MISSHSTVTLILFLIVSCLFLPSYETITVDTPDRDAEGRPLLRLTSSQLCESCQTTIEDFYIMMITKIATGQRELEMTYEELLKNFCQGWPMTSYRKHFEWGCLKLLSENHREILAPFIGHLTVADFPSYRQIFDHRTSMCHRYGSCPWSDYAYPTIVPTSRCDACNRVVADVTWMIERHKIKNMTLVKGAMEGVCTQIPIRHIQYSMVHDMCHELMEDHPTAISQHLLSFSSSSDSLLDLQFSICGPALMEVCDQKQTQMSMSTHKPGDELYMTEEQKKKKRRQEQAALDKKRKEKKEKKKQKQIEEEEREKQRQEEIKLKREQLRAEREQKEAEEAAAAAARAATPAPEIVVASREKAAPFRKKKNIHVTPPAADTASDTPPDTDTDTATATDADVTSVPDTKEDL